MAFRLSTAARNAAANGAIDLLNTGGAGTIRVLTSTQETNVGDADSGTLLGTLTFSATSFGAASTGVKTANSITSDSSADNSGTAGHFRLYTGTPAINSDGTCGQGTGDMSFDNSVIVAGGVIACSSFTVTQPIQ
jgi:hypothetical protein